MEVKSEVPYGAMRGARRETITTTRDIIAPYNASLLLNSLSCFIVLPSLDSRRSPLCTFNYLFWPTRNENLLVSNPRVNDPIAYVDEHVNYHDRSGYNQYTSLDKRIIP